MRLSIQILNKFTTSFLVNYKYQPFFQIIKSSGCTGVRCLDDPDCAIAIWLLNTLDASFGCWHCILISNNDKFRPCSRSYFTAILLCLLYYTILFMTTILSVISMVASKFELKFKNYKVL